VFVVGSDIPQVSLEFAIDMLRKLTTEPDVYDCACLIVVEGAGGTVEEPTADDRDIDEEPTALLNLPEVEDAEGVVDQEAEAPIVSADVALHPELIPHDLSAGRFFQTLVGAALDRMPVAVYPEVRQRRAEVLTSPPTPG
jgi:hypothetical protein